MLLHAVILVKNILDPELPAASFRIDEAARGPVTGIGPLVLGPFERSALEIALKLKDSGTVDHLTAITADGPSAEDALRKAFAVGVDEAVLVDTSNQRLDPAQTAVALTAAIARLTPVDLVVAGRQAGDWDQGQVGYLVAEALGWPCVSLVRSASVGDDGELVLKHDTVAGQEVVAVRPPAVITVTNDDSTVLRMAKVQAMMLSQRKPITTWKLEELGRDDRGPSFSLLELRIPESGVDCELVEGDDPDEVAALLLDRLAELKLL